LFIIQYSPVLLLDVLTRT